MMALSEGALPRLPEAEEAQSLFGDKAFANCQAALLCHINDFLPVSIWNLWLQVRGFILTVQVPTKAKLLQQVKGNLGWFTFIPPRTRTTAKGALYTLILTAYATTVSSAEFFSVKGTKSVHQKSVATACQLETDGGTPKLFYM
jgi:hypothetical protein